MRRGGERDPQGILRWGRNEGVGRGPEPIHPLLVTDRSWLLVYRLGRLCQAAADSPVAVSAPNLPAIGP